MERSTRFVCSVAATCIYAATAMAQQQAGPPVVVQPGIVLHPALGVAYVMSPNGGIDAIDLASGELRWSTPAGAKPIAVVGDLLVVQTQTRRQSSTLELAALDTRRRGTVSRSARIQLSPSVRVAVDETLRGEFLTGARVEGGSVIVAWEFIAHELGGDMELERARKPVVEKGMVRFNPVTGEIARVDGGPEVPAGARAYKLVGRERIEQDSGTQFVSNDNRHVLVTQRVADDRVWDKYRWTVYTRTAGRLGETRMHEAFAPFAVENSLLFFVTEPYTRGGRDEPLKLRAVSLATGKEIWGRQVRDTKLRGPFPP